MNGSDHIKKELLRRHKLVAGEINRLGLDGLNELGFETVFGLLYIFDKEGYIVAPVNLFNNDHLLLGPPKIWKTNEEVGGDLVDVVHQVYPYDGERSEVIQSKLKRDSTVGFSSISGYIDGIINGMGTRSDALSEGTDLKTSMYTGPYGKDSNDKNFFMFERN